MENHISSKAKRSSVKTTTAHRTKKTVVFKRWDKAYPNGALIVQSQGSPDEVTSLKEVTMVQLLKMRREIIKDSQHKCALLIYKIDDKLFVGRIPKKFHVNSTWGTHKCAMCEHCSAACDDDGGCGKVRNTWLPAGSLPQEILSNQELLKEYFMSLKMIEKYAFINEGVELLNIENGTELYVFKCNKFENYWPRKELPPMERSELIRSTIELLFDSVTIKRNKKGPNEYW